MAVGRVTSAAFFTLTFFLCITLLSAKPPTHGFTLNLIHRDSLNSLNSPLTNSDDDDRFVSIRSAITRSIAKANRISTLGHGLDTTSNPETNVISTGGEYIMNVSLGTPPFPILAIADTGSDLTWTQCKPCSNCYKQNAPLFDPSKSSTYKLVSCSAPQCSSSKYGYSPSCGSSKKCQYSISYGDQSTSKGAIAAETVTLGTAKFRKMILGCGFANQGTFSEVGSGIIGLGNGFNSLTGQIGKSIGGKFSYCLAPLFSSNDSKSSKINFGKNAVVSGRGVVSTRIVTKGQNAYYWITLEAITIGKVRVPYINPPDFIAGGVDYKGNIIIDSGTTLLILPEETYTNVEKEVSKQVRGKRVGAAQSLNLCYEMSSFKAPEITMNFERADVKLNDYNAFVEAAEGVICFASVPSTFGIYGNLAQMNFLIGYDKVKRRISFKPADCGNLSV